MKKKITLSKAKKRAWEAFSKFIRLRDAIKTTGTKTHLKCITCNRKYKAFGVGCAHAGHFVGGRNNSILIDEKFVNGQCQICNRWKKGNYVRYEMKMIEMWGKKAVEDVKLRSLETKSMNVFEWLEVEKKYLKKYEDIGGTSTK